jgi:hypothetical protein
MRDKRSAPRSWTADKCSQLDHLALVTLEEGVVHTSTVMLCIRLSTSSDRAFNVACPLDLYVFDLDAWLSLTLEHSRST